jgi:hypothetical protein
MIRSRGVTRRVRLQARLPSPYQVALGVMLVNTGPRKLNSIVKRIKGIQGIFSNFTSDCELNLDPPHDTVKEVEKVSL